MSKSPSDKPQEQPAEQNPDLLKEAFDVFSKASQQLEQSYNELKKRADRLAKELAQTNAELQKQLAEKERISSFLENILNSIPSGIIVISRNGSIALTNAIAGEIFGKQVLAESAHIDEIISEPDAKEFIDSCMSRTDSQGARRECEFRQGDDGTDTVIELSYAPVHSPDGKRIASLIVAQDISRLKELETQMVRTNRLAAMGEMAAQLAHEIRNPLGSIELFASLLGRDLRGTENQKLADNIVIGVKSLNSVVTNMLTFTRSITISPERLPVNELIEEIISFMEHVLAVESIDLDLMLDETAGEVELDPELIKQVLLNLAQNSIFAMEESQKPVLQVSSRNCGHDDGRGGVEIVIADNGCGIAEADLKKIFDPFFSTRKGGTGLGLSVVSQIIEKHHGFIIADSKLGEGTAMKIWLPAELVH